MRMKIRGVTYDVGTPTVSGGLTRPPLSRELVEQEMRVIARELHCNAVRISGQHLDQLKLAADAASREGLEIWLSPTLHDTNEQEAFEQIIAVAGICEEFRQLGSQVVLVLGCELSVFMSGLIPGNDGLERLAALSDPTRWTAEFFANGSPVERLNNFLAHTANEVRQHFNGPVTYAAGLWEDINWDVFDIIGIDAYRDAGNASNYRDTLRNYLGHGKPVVVTEFGCCTYEGAENQGGMGWLVVDRQSTPMRLSKPLVRNESVQAHYLTELLALFEEEGVTGAFVFTFVSPSYPSNLDPSYDLDTASYSLVRTWNVTSAATAAATSNSDVNATVNAISPSTSAVTSGPESPQPRLPWEAKEAFYAVAQAYGQLD